MEPPTDQARNRALLQLAKLCFLRSKGESSEDQIARELGFVDDQDGASLREAMYERLEHWGLPGWVVRPEEEGEQAGTRGEEVPKKRRKARSTGGSKELPPAGRAAGLFREDLERLSYYLGQLPVLRQQLKAERFVSSSWVGEDWEYLHKDDYLRSYEDGTVSGERWVEICEACGEDPSEDVIRVPIDPVMPQGASPTPWEGLVPLIAVHALLHEPDDGADDRSIEGAVDGLIGALHPDPASVDRAALYKRKGMVDQLRTSAENLAKTLRGVEVRRGHHPGTVSNLDHWVALYLIGPLATKDLTDEAIHSRIARKHPSLGERYDVKDVGRLRGLRLPPPDRPPPEDPT